MNIRLNRKEDAAFACHSVSASCNGKGCQRPKAMSLNMGLRGSAIEVTFALKTKHHAHVPVSSIQVFPSEGRDGNIPEVCRLVVLWSHPTPGTCGLVGFSLNSSGIDLGSKQIL